MLNNIYGLCAKGQHRKAIAEALDFFDDLLIERRFDVCDRAFVELETHKLASAVMVSILGITVRAKGKLRFREHFWRRAWGEVAKTRGAAYTAELLDKYR